MTRSDRESYEAIGAAVAICAFFALLWAAFVGPVSAAPDSHPVEQPPAVSQPPAPAGDIRECVVNGAPCGRRPVLMAPPVLPETGGDRDLAAWAVVLMVNGLALTYFVRMKERNG